MPYAKIDFQPGLSRDDTPLQNKGRFVNADKVRFLRGKPQTVGGWEKATTSQVTGVARCIHSWVDNDRVAYAGIGTHQRLHVYSDGSLYDITPEASTGTLNGPFDTVSGDATVTVNDTAHGLVLDQKVNFSGATAGGGITIDGDYTVTEVVSANEYTIEHSAAATSTANGTGGANVDYIYYLAPGNIDGLGGAGYGTGGYGSGTYGTSSSESIFARQWTLDNWGENLIACPRQGTIYEWSPNLSGLSPAAAISNAPSQVEYAFVTAERILVAAGAHDGSTFDPLRVAWSDQEDNTTWTPASTNQAGFFTLAEGSTIVGCAKGRGNYGIWTDSGLYTMTYVPDPSVVYRFDLVGTGCGLAGTHAAVEANGVFYWLSNSFEFYRYAGGTPQALQCPVRREVADTIAKVQSDKVYAFHNSTFNEVWWLYPRTNNEVSHYVAFNYIENTWTVGTFDRTTWADSGVEDFPLAVDSSGYVYFQEKGFSDDGAAMSWFLESGAFDIGDGATLYNILSMMHDVEDQQGGYNVTLYSRVYPNGTERTFGPYGVVPTTTKTDLRVNGRQVRVRWDGNDGPTFFRLGQPRFDIRPTTELR